MCRKRTAAAQRATSAYIHTYVVGSHTGMGPGWLCTGMQHVAILARLFVLVALVGMSSQGTSIGAMQCLFICTAIAKQLATVC